ncbi:hypothetical protein K458DRAFT_188970 [Lentithecium fluviatile CBS 122367]|uniref:Uncharacterized protein n=1 Tax=Lentithecium fluviatile CBS 122367 TaxID=1168545 RepID=A0A6G1JAQ4_9PLEO|nr:hypothetical protein K458DRAFT_188970 [Lentithecium fluviatile CBS 122367]
MSSAATIKALKESNTIEEDLVNMMKEGLNMIADSMLQECRKRNAALEDLEEKMGQELACSTSSKTFDGNLELAGVLFNIISDYNKAIEESYERYETAFDERQAAFDQQKGWDTAWTQHEERIGQLTDLLKLAKELEKRGIPDLCLTVNGMYKKEVAACNGEENRLEVEQSKIAKEKERSEKKVDQCYRAYEMSMAQARERVEKFEKIAEMASVKLDA